MSGPSSSVQAQIWAATQWLSQELENQLRPMIQRVYKNDPFQFQAVLAFLEHYVKTADENNYKWWMAADIHYIMQEIQNPIQAPTLSTAQINTLLSHLPATPRDREVLILEFSDIQCPFCQRHHNNATLNAVTSKYPTAQSYFFDFPLSFHPQALPAAIMRQCVQRFQWYDAMKTYVDNAMNGWASVENDVLQALYDMWYDDATQQEILDCYTNTETQKWVDSQMELWKSLGVTGTPANIIIDRYTKSYTKISWAVPATSFDKPLQDIASGDLSSRAQWNTFIKLVPDYLAMRRVVNVPTIAPNMPQPTQRKADLSTYIDFLNTAYIEWNKDAKVSIIEFSDVQCPFCQRHTNNWTLDTVSQKYGNDVNVIFAHFPLNFHPNAQKAWEAIECAWDQWGQKWFTDMKKAYFAKWWDSNLELAKEAAIEAWLDADILMDCVSAGTYAQKVKDQMAYGQSLWVTGTPWNIVINNETLEYVKVSGAVPATAFDAPVSNYLK